MNRGLSWLGGLGLGAGLMYIFDPDRGHARRAHLRDRAIHGGRVAEHAISEALHNACNHTRGAVAETVGRWVEEPIADEVLVERVRAKLGHLVQHAHGIQVSAAAGTVTLEGPVPVNEADTLLHGVSHVRGVRHIENRLRMLEPNGTSAACCQGADVMTYLRWPLLVGIVGATGAYLYQRARRPAVEIYSEAEGATVEVPVPGGETAPDSETESFEPMAPVAEAA